jgi:hypothetical protein
VGKTELTQNKQIGSSKIAAGRKKQGERGICKVCLILMSLPFKNKLKKKCQLMMS